MTKAKILEEVEGVDLLSLGDGLSFTDLYEQTLNITAIEQLLFYCNCTKYYYNYSEKRLRKLVNSIENIINCENEDCVIFSCVDDEDETTIEIKAKDFADKIVCLEDYHKVVTYDPNTKHYECFFVDLSKKKINEFFETAKSHLPEGLKHLISGPKENIAITQELPSDDVIAAFKTICNYLSSNKNDLSKISFINTDEGVQVDLVSSRLYQGDDDCSSFLS